MSGGFRDLAISAAILVGVSLVLLVLMVLTGQAAVGWPFYAGVGGLVTAVDATGAAVLILRSRLGIPGIDVTEGMQKLSGAAHIGALFCMLAIGAALIAALR